MVDLERTLKNFKKNGFLVLNFNTKEEATEYLVEKLKNLTIGFGDSETLKAMNLYESLSLQNKVIDPQNCKIGEDFYKIASETYGTEIFITSVNGATETGELINIDGTGNRIGSSLYGHKKVYFIFGINKIEKNLEKAIWRARNIAAPQNAKRLKLNTPCAILGDRCYDCNSKDRICNCMNIYMKKMESTIMEVIIINEVLGF